MNRTLPEGRLPLKDRSKLFQNKGQFSTPNDKVKRVKISSPTTLQSQQNAPFNHTLKPPTEDNNQYELLGTSTPKKDGQITFLTHKIEEKTKVDVEDAQEKDKTNDKELIKWRNTWKSLLPHQHIYFENDDSNVKEKKKAMLSLKKVGAVIEPFFDDNINIVVSRRSYDKRAQYLPGDLFGTLKKRGIKVWNYDKVFRFMQHLGESVADIDTNDTQLEDLLQNERILGPSDKDPSVKREDMKYFIGPYLYIYDITQRLRPIAVREWKDKRELPSIKRTTNGKSIFVEEAKSTSTASLIKRHKRRLQNLEECCDYRLMLEDACFPKGFEHLRRPDYWERIAMCERYLAQYYSRHPEEEPNVKYKGTDFSNFEISHPPAFKKQKILTSESKDTKQITQEDLRLAQLIADADDIDTAARQRRLEKSKKIDKIKFDIPALPAPPLGIRRENSVFGTGTNKEIQHKKISVASNASISNTINGNNGKLLCEYGEIVASGVAQSGSAVVGYSQGKSGSNTIVGNGLAPSRASTTSRTILNDSRRTVVLGGGAKESNNHQLSHQEKQENHFYNEITKDIGNQETKLDFNSVNNISLINNNQFKKNNSSAAIWKRLQRKLETCDPLNPFNEIPTHHDQSQNNTQNALISTAATPVTMAAQITANKTKKKHEMKPGYCENCRMKYADFDEHVIGDVHRQFATNNKNFTEIDLLISDVVSKRSFA